VYFIFTSKILKFKLCILISLKQLCTNVIEWNHKLSCFRNFLVVIGRKVLQICILACCILNNSFLISLKIFPWFLKRLFTSNIEKHKEENVIYNSNSQRSPWSLIVTSVFDDQKYLKLFLNNEHCHFYF
jgi:hypothetical protein